MRCQSCRAISVFDAGRVGQRCDFCGSAALVPHEEVKDAFRPESLLPFAIAEPRARDVLRSWYRGLWFAPARFAARALTDTLKGVYVPYWTFDAKADATWTAEAGHTYTVEVGGKRERRVRWTSASGSLSHAFDDELVCASRGVEPARLRAIEPFPTDTLVPYDPGYLAGWVVERYQIDLVAAAERSRRTMDARLRELCARQVPGDTHRNLQVHASYRDQTFKHILAPLWLATYTHHGRDLPGRRQRRDRQGVRRPALELGQDRPRRLARAAGPLRREPARVSPGRGPAVSGRTCRASARARRGPPPRQFIGEIVPPDYSSRSRCRAARCASLSVVSWWSSGSGWSQPMASGAFGPTSNFRYWTDDTRVSPTWRSS